MSALRDGKISVEALTRTVRDPLEVARVRRIAIRALAAGGSGHAREALHELVTENPPQDVLAELIRACGVARVSGVATALAKTISKGTGPEAIEAARVLPKLAPLRTARDALAQGMKAKRPELRAACAEGMGSLGDSAAAEILYSGFRDEADATVRRAIAQAMAGAGGDMAERALREWCRSDPSEEVRAEAALGLGNFTSQETVGVLAERLLREGESDDVRGAAAAALGAIGTGAAGKALLAALKSNLAGAVHEAALAALGNTPCTEETIAWLTARFQGAESEYSRLRAACSLSRLLGKLRDGKVQHHDVQVQIVAFLRDLLEEKHLRGRPRVMAFRALAYLPCEEALALLRRLTESPDEQVKRQAQFVLKRRETCKSPLRPSEEAWAAMLKRMGTPQAAKDDLKSQSPRGKEGGSK